MEREHLRDRARRAAIALGDDMVHLWHGDPCRFFDMTLLSSDELERITRYRFLAHAMAFGACRSAMRTILSGYLGCRPGDVRFSYGPHGKPSILHPSAEITINLSHSGKRMLLAVARTLTLGVDIEAIVEARRAGEAIGGTLNMAERLNVAAAESVRVEELLLRYWTQKEAFLKYLGKGLSIPLTSVHVEFEDLYRTVIKMPTSHLQTFLYGRVVDCGTSHVGALVVDPRASSRNFRL